MSGISYISENLSSHPVCPHGPTLLFQRAVKDLPKQFFACSACRDRKDCSFFVWKDELLKHNNDLWLKRAEEFVATVNHEKSYEKFQKTISLEDSQRTYCINCQTFIFKENLSDFKKHHENHSLSTNLSKHLLLHPSEFLKPLDDSKKEAQYLFSKKSVETIVGMLQNLYLGKIYVLCICAPRIYEYIAGNSSNSNFKALLMDFDKRYFNFFKFETFIWYNIFNHHFFFEESKEVVYRKFLEDCHKNKGNLVIITDPPFGGRIEPIAQTLQTINKEYQEYNRSDVDDDKDRDNDCEIPTFWVFPYFMEPQIQNSLPHFKMMDYKVNYDNHCLFSSGSKGRKFGSPVRIFTNVDLSLIKLPESEGYKKCFECNRWVSAENIHCDSCKECTSKDGRTYIHCSLCKRCVKPSWKHCEKCERCAQVDHKCGLQLQFSQECFHCKKAGHKKRDCPEVDHQQLQQKRQRMEKSKIGSKKKRRK